MNLSAVTFFCVNYPNRRSIVECKQLVWVGATSREHLIRQRSRFPRTAQNPVALQQQRPGRTYPTRRDAASRAGRPRV